MFALTCRNVLISTYVLICRSGHYSREPPHGTRLGRLPRGGRTRTGDRIRGGGRSGHIGPRGRQPVRLGALGAVTAKPVEVSCPDSATRLRKRLMPRGVCRVRAPRPEP